MTPILLVIACLQALILRSSIRLGTASRRTTEGLRRRLLKPAGQDLGAAFARPGLKPVQLHSGRKSSLFRIFLAGLECCRIWRSSLMTPTSSPPAAPTWRSRFPKSETSATSQRSPIQYSGKRQSQEVEVVFEEDFGRQKSAHFPREFPNDTIGSALKCCRETFHHLCNTRE